MSSFPVHDTVMEKLSSTVQAVAEKLLDAKKQNRFVLVKFHHDADGITAALALSRILPCNAVQQNAANYSSREALRDLALLHPEKTPLLILADLGSGDGSMEGLQLVHAAGIEIIVIDHHPSAPAAAEHISLFLNPWNVLPNATASKYTAGYLACEVAHAAGIQDIALLAAISCSADKSTLLPVTAEHRNQALVLDYLAMHAAYGNNLRFYKTVLEKPALYRSILQQLQEKLTQIGTALQRHAKPKILGALTLYTLALDDVAAAYEFPSKGKITTYFLEHAGIQTPLVVIGYGGRSVVLRANDAAQAHGVHLNELVDQFLPSMDRFIESGGGHPKASAIRVRPGFAKEVARAFAHLLETKFNTVPETSPP